MTVDIRRQWEQSSRIEKILVSSSIVGTGITAALIPLKLDTKYTAGVIVITALSLIIGFGVSEYKRYQGRII